MKIKLAKKEIIHFIGIGGIGMSGLSLIMKGQGFKVQGSDLFVDEGITFMKTTKGPEKVDIIYERYKKQIQCTHTLIDKILDKLDSNDQAQDSTVVIHGDHGSRIPWKRDGTVSFSTEEYIQWYSTFFSIRYPDVVPGYDRRPFSLDELLQISSQLKPDFKALEVKPEKFVYSFPRKDEKNRYAPHEKYTLPPFAKGSRVQTW